MVLSMALPVCAEEAPSREAAVKEPQGAPSREAGVKEPQGAAPREAEVKEPHEAARSTVQEPKGKAAKPREDLPNFHEVYPYLYRSGEPSIEGLKKLKEMGVTTIFDLRAPSEQHFFDEKPEARALGFKYNRIVMTSAAPTDKQVSTIMRAIEKAKEDPSKGKVLVHCAHGSDRTGCIIGIWRVTHDGWTYDEAYKEMRKYWFSPKFTHLSDPVKERAKSEPSKAEAVSK